MKLSGTLAKFKGTYFKISATEFLSNSVYLGYQQRRVAVAEETEVVREGVVVDLMPVALYKGTHKEQERGLRLVEIGDEHLHNLVVVAWGNDNLGAAVEDVQLVGVHP